MNNNSWSSFGRGDGSATLKHGDLDKTLMVLSFEAHLALSVTDSGMTQNFLLFSIEGFRPKGDVNSDEKISLLFPLGMAAPIVSEILAVGQQRENPALTERDMEELTKGSFEPVLMWRDKTGKLHTIEEAVVACGGAVDHGNEEGPSVQEKS